MSGDLKPGQLVRSIAGRDKGCWMIVKQTLDDKFVEVIDGELRLIKRPKKKNIRHLQSTGRVEQNLSKLLAGAQKITDADVRKTIQRMLKPEK